MIISACIFFLSPAYAGAFCFEEAGNLYGIDPRLLKSIARVESGLNSKAVNINKNGSTDYGLMQINSAWIDTFQLNRNELLSDPCYNVMTGARVLKGCIDRRGYTWQAVGCYNAVNQSRQVGYSWKIYRLLKKEAERYRKMAKNNDDVSPGLKSARQSLHFRVRAIEENGSSREP